MDRRLALAAALAMSAVRPDARVIQTYKSGGHKESPSRRFRKAEAKRPLQPLTAARQAQLV